MDDKVLVRLGHGYYSGGITLLPDFCPTIDAHIDCWHILIGEKMKNEDIKCKCVGMLGGEKYEKMHDIARRVYDTNGIAPTQHTCGGGNLETKVVEPLALDEQNGYIRQDGTVGTLTTDGSSPKHNNRVIYAQKQMADSTEEPCGCNIRQGGEDYYRVPLENVSRALRTFDNAGVSTKHYIRKLTPKECGRLMGVRDDDIDMMSVNQSNSSLYHCFGDSIVVDVLMAIFKQML